MEDGFHSVSEIARKEREPQNVRQVEGDGTPFLRVPGLQKVHAVRVGPLEMPLAIEQQIPLDASLTQLETVRTPLVRLERTADGETVLLRHVQSNDGIWQKGVPVFVTGEWEAEKTAQKPENKKSE